MNSIEYLDAVRARLGGISDYAAAKHLQVTRAFISHVRCGKNGFGDESAVRIAALLGVDPAHVLADLAGERSKSPAARAVWRRVAATFVACNVLLAVPLGLWLTNGGETLFLARSLPESGYYVKLQIAVVGALGVLGLIAFAVMHARPRATNSAFPEE